MSEMEMPTPCERCNELFDLLDGTRSPRNPRIVICEGCAGKEQEEVNKEEEIIELQEEIADAEDTIKRNTERLRELGVSVKLN